MKLRGRIHDGKIVLDGRPVLPDGAVVIVEIRESEVGTCAAPEIQFPLFHSKNPGSLNLSNQRIAEILEDEELSS